MVKVPCAQFGPLPNGRKYTFNIRENKSNWFLTLVLSVTSDFRF